MNNTSNEYTLQGVYTANSYLGTITSLQYLHSVYNANSYLGQVFLAIYDTDIIMFSYTGSENIDITDNQVSLISSIKINEIVLNPRAHDGAVFDMLSGTDIFAFRQNSLHGGTPIAQLYSSTKERTFYGDCSIPNLYNKSSIDTLISNIYNDIYNKTGIDTLFSNIYLSNYYTKTETDDLDNELPTLALNAYNKSGIDTFSPIIITLNILILNLV